MNPLCLTNGFKTAPDFFRILMIVDGDYMTGILPLWKPKGLTSHDCVMKIRRLYNIKKVGHTGTLDPEVEGVLPICIGQATKIVPYLTSQKKEYNATVQLGVATETEDAYGNIVETKEITQPPTTTDIDHVLQLFKGTITQVPPMYSAVRVKGKRLYEYARANQTAERPTRQVTIYEINRISELTNRSTAFQMKVVCSQGTYIRTLCVDIGKQLGYPAHMSHLIRTEAGSFTRNEAVTFADIKQAKTAGKLHTLLQPIVRGLRHMKKIYVNHQLKSRVLHGQKLRKPTEIVNSDPFLMMYDEQLLAIYETHPRNSNTVKPVRVFSG